MIEAFRSFLSIASICIVTVIVSCNGNTNNTAKTKSITAEEARVIAKEAYIYAFPVVDNLRVQYAFFIDKTNSEYKAPYNTLFNIPRVFTPEDKTIQAPNSDTPYSWIGLDLRTEPMVFIIPKLEQGRYWSLQAFQVSADAPTPDSEHVF